MILDLKKLLIVDCHDDEPSAEAIIIDDDHEVDAEAIIIDDDHEPNADAIVYTIPKWIEDNSKSDYVCPVTSELACGAKLQIKTFFVLSLYQIPDAEVRK